MIWLLLALVFFSALGFWYWRARFVRNVSSTQLSTRIEDFLGYADVGGVLDIEAERSPASVQLALHGTPGVRPELLFGVADVAWSHDLFDSMVFTLEREGFPVELELAPQPGLPVSRWLTVLLRDAPSELAGRAHQLVLTAFRSLGVRDSTTFRVRYRGSIGPQAWARVREARRGAA